MRKIAVLSLAGLILASVGAAARADELNLAEAVFTAAERVLIREYFGVDANRIYAPEKSGKGGKDGLPPGLAKRERLPPGLEQQLVRSGTLPPGLEKRRLPGALDGRLRPRRGAEAIIVDDDVLLVVAATGLIIDIIKDVVR